MRNTILTTEIMTGKVFGRLTVIDKAETKRASRYLCKCKCGTVKIIDGFRLRNGHTQSCGCLQRDVARKLAYKHGLSYTAFYFIFNQVNHRCNNRCNAVYKYYGGRGIKNLWNSIDEFKNDMHKSYLQHIQKFGKGNTSIDRIDNNGHYCKENCRWVTRKEQNNNTRQNRYLSYNGKKLSIAEWARASLMHPAKLRSRIRRKWTVERALTKP